MQFGFSCMECLMRMELDRIRFMDDNQKKIACAKEFFSVVASAPEGISAPALVPAFDEIFARYFCAEEDPQRTLKQRSGEIMLERLPALRRRVLEAADPLYAALQYSRIGNYIDFASFGTAVDFHRLDELLESAEDTVIDAEEYRRFREDLQNGRSLLLVTDNAGEIVLDRILLEVLRKMYPQLSLTVCVRGGPALNDALREDAEAAGIPAFASVIDNGSSIGGMEEAFLGAKAKEALDGASVILSKGQANLETLLGCGRNIYYLFLCKCVRFTTMFRVPPMTGLFLNERRMPSCDPLC